MSINRTQYTIVKPDTHDEWLALRSRGIGSSEIAVLAGLSRFDTPIGLFRKKMGLVPPEEETDVMRAGHEFEPLVALRYAQASGDVMDPASEGDWIAYNNDKPYLRVSPDRLFWNRNVPEGMRTLLNAYILECKTTKMDVSPDDYPKSWYFQVQYQMGVMGIRKAVIAWFSSAGALHFGYVEVPFNEDIYNDIVELADDFWHNHIETGIIPDTIINEGDASLRWPNANENACAADENMLSLVYEYNSLNDVAKEVKDRMEEIKLSVKTFMKDSSTLCSDKGKILVTWKNSSVADSFDKAKFASDHPDMYSQYVKTGQTSRRLIFK